MNEIRATEITMEVFSHATEEPTKVLKALFSIIPADWRSKTEINEESARGYFKNPIIIYRLKLSRREVAEQTFSFLAKEISNSDKSRLGEEIRRRVDDSGKLFLRLDKQAAYKGVVSVRQDDDTIKLMVRFSGYPCTKDRVIETLRKTGLII